MLVHVRSLCMLCPLTILLGVLSVLAGILQIVFAGDGAPYAATSGNGITAGALAIAAAVVGLLSLRKAAEFNYEESEAINQKTFINLYFGGHQITAICAMSFGIQDLVQGAMILGDCGRPIETIKPYCHHALAGSVSMGTANLLLGIVIFVISCMFMGLVHKTRKQLGLPYCYNPFCT